MQELNISECLGKHPPKTPEKKIEEAIKEVWTKTPADEVKTIETPEFTGWQWLAIVSSILALTFFVGYVSKDTYVQDRIEAIQFSQAEIRRQETVIVKANNAIATENAKIEKAKDELKTKKIKYE